MAGRIRTIKPELLEDDVTASLSHEAWRLFVSLLIIADDYGNFRANPKYLEGQAFWARESGASVSRIILELVESGLLTTYTVRGQQYGAIAGWSKHQRVDKPGRPRVPGPQDTDIVDDSAVPESVENDSGTVREPLAPDLRPTTPTADRRPGGDGAVLRFRMTTTWRPTDDSRQACLVALIPEWALDQFVGQFVGNFVNSGEECTDADWNKRWVKWVSRGWNDPKRRPSKPGVDQVDEDTAMAARFS